MYELNEGMSSSENDFSSLSSGSELSNGTENTSVPYIPVYIQNYLKTVEHMPTGIMREISKIMEIHVKMQKNFQEIDMIKSQMKNSAHLSKSDMREHLQFAKRKLQRILELEEIKSTSIQIITSIIDKGSTQLDEDHNRALQFGVMDNDIPSPIYSNEEQAEDSNAADDTNDNDVDSNSSKKLTKRTSSSSRGRGRRSLAQKEEELDSSLNTSRGSSAPRKKAGRKRRDRKSSPNLLEIDPDEPRYCLCNEVSYGEMIGCDNNNCPIEWFHFRCVNLTAKPKGKWFCPNCTQDKKKNTS